MLAVFALFGSVAGILQLVVTLIERRNRVNRAAAGLPSKSSEDLIHQLRESARVAEPEQPEDPQPTNESSHIENPPIHPEKFAVAWRSAIAYMLGWIGGLIFWRNSHALVRFHAAQSLLIDVATVLYLVVSCCALVPYTAARYPGAEKIASNDPVMWTWTIFALVGPPAAHLIMAILTIMGRNPRIPIIWRLAATMAFRPAHS